MGRRDSLPRKTKKKPEKQKGRLSGITLDAGAMIALDRDDRRVIALLARTVERGMRVTIPATALAQAIRNPARQARLSRLIRQAGTDLIALNGPDATAVGLLLAKTGTADIVDAHVVVCARRTGQAVITSDPGDLQGLAPDLKFVSV
ncbi:MAG: PIN domain-containing protein, partial [Bryobacteraceae bacterium]